MEWTSLHNLLKDIDASFLPKAAGLIAVGRIIGGVGAVFYIGSRVWHNLANHEPIDFYPLFRPFVIAFFIGIYPAFITGIKTVCEPLVAVTEQMAGTTNQDILAYQKAKDGALRKLAEKNDQLYLVDDADYEKRMMELGIFDKELYVTAFEKAKYDIKQTFSNILFNILEFLYQGIALVIDAIRTFFLIFIVMIGPFSMGISIWDGFRDTLQFWVARYIQIFLWLPIANIVGAILAQIQVLMLKNAIDEINASGSVYSMESISGGDVSYMLFLLIGIFAYTTIPTLAGFVLQSCGAGNATRTFTRNAMNVGNTTGAGAGAVLGATGKGAAAGAKKVGEAAGKLYRRFRPSGRVRGGG